LFYKVADGKVDNMTSDNEASFKNAIKAHPNIKYWLVDIGDKGKVGMVERFNRTLRGKITTYMKLHKTKTWHLILPDLLTNYNNSVHNITNVALNKFDIKTDGPCVRLKAKAKGKKALPETNSFAVGDKVRILKVKEKFAKGTEKFSKKDYKIVNNDKLSFKLKNDKRTELKQRFKNWQLKKINEVAKPALKLIIEQKHKANVIRKENKLKKLEKQAGIYDYEETKLLVPSEVKRVSKPVAKPVEEVKTVIPKDLVGKR
jgi:hypothetical protein